MNGIRWVALAVWWYKDESVRLIRSMPDGDTIVLMFLMMLALAGERNQNGSLPYSENELSVLFNIPSEITHKGIDILEAKHMIERDGCGYYITNWEKYQDVQSMEKIRENARVRSAKRRQKKKQEMKPSPAPNKAHTAPAETDPPLFEIDDQTVRDHNEILDAAQDAGFPNDNATMTRLIDLYAEYGKKAVLDGITACVDSNVKTIRYLKGCCKKSKGYAFIRNDGTKVDDRGHEIWDSYVEPETSDDTPGDDSDDDNEDVDMSDIW